MSGYQNQQSPSASRQVAGRPERRRCQGEPIHPEHYVGFSNQMASAWAQREGLESERSLPSIYALATPDWIVDHAVADGWHKT